ncbi:MAG: LysR family transcriptional regulator [Myxococcota bacterium]
MDTDHLRVFLAIVEQGSLASAGRALGLSSSTVTERLAGLESHYGARLLHRTTRALTLTEAGEALHEGATLLLADADALASRVRAGVESLAGSLRVSAPVDFGRTQVAPIFDAFLAEHPGVVGELVLVDGYVDVLAERVDVAVRFGALADSSLRVRKVGENRRIVCAAPSYLDAHGQPSMPEDLASHNCLRMRFGRHLDREWPFREGRRRYTVRVDGDRIANDGGLVRHWCLEGRGIALKSRWDVADDLAAGRLVELLEAYAPKPSALQLVFPPGPTQPRRSRAFADVLLAALREE